MPSILVVGSGGREHALVWKLARSACRPAIYCCPGNAGISLDAKCLPVSADDVEAIVRTAKDYAMDLVVIGPEIPLAAGIVDGLKDAGIPAFGPSAAAARLESSKVFSKCFMRDHGIPTAPFDVCCSMDEAIRAVNARQGRCVVKADGLAAGKGVMVCSSFTEALDACRTILVERKFGDAGRSLIVEDLLEGEEASIMAVCDGRTALVLESSQDHKRVQDQDKGPNTGGMGAYSPAPVAGYEMCGIVKRTIIDPVMENMEREGMPFTGILYAGIMISKGRPFALEFNVRFGDPETQVVLPRLQSDLFDVIRMALDGRLHELPPLEWDPRPVMSVVMASAGYPGEYRKGYPITGLDRFDSNPDVFVFHAGTRWIDGKICTSGGRVLNVTAYGTTFAMAQENAYKAVDMIDFSNKYFRHDIGWRVTEQ